MIRRNLALEFPAEISDRLTWILARRSSPTLACAVRSGGSLAASYGHLGRIDEAKSALANHRELTSRLMGSSNLLNPDPKLLQALRDGIAMAEGKMPPDAATDG